MTFINPDPDELKTDKYTLKSSYNVGDHSRLIAAAFQSLVEGRRKRVALSIPPQHGKSEIFSRCGLAWAHGTHPTMNIMFGTYSDSFSWDFGDQVLEIMSRERFLEVFPKYRLRKGGKSKRHLVSSKGGQINFVGRGGAGTGKPADLFIIDDPLKNEEEASSIETRDIVYKWYTRVAMSRCHKGSRIGVIHTRWHDDDLIGRLCDPEHPDYNEKRAKQWLYINVPAILQDDEVTRALGRKPGDVLWPWKYSIEFFEEARQLDPLGFEALYQGRPSLEGGYHFKAGDILEYERDDLPPNLTVFAASDHAVSTKQRNDNSVIGCVGVCSDGDIWVLPDLFYDKADTFKQVEEILEQIKRNRPVLWWMESENISKSFGPFLIKRMQETHLYCLLDPVTPSKDKTTRSRAIQARMQMHKVHFPKFAAWWPTAKAELLKFPNAKHDDFVDWLSWIGLGLLKETSPATMVRGEGEDKGYTVGRMLESAKRKATQAKVEKSMVGW